MKYLYDKACRLRLLVNRKPDKYLISEIITEILRENNFTSRNDLIINHKLFIDQEDQSNILEIRIRDKRTLVKE